LVPLLAKASHIDINGFPIDKKVGVTNLEIRLCQTGLAKRVIVRLSANEYDMPYSYSRMTPYR